jgi:hypothetical protein
VKRTAPSTVVAVIVCGAVAGVILQIALANASLATLRPEYTLAATLILAAVLIIALAGPVRRSTRGSERAPVDPFYATRVVILAKASAVAGALLAGGAVGLLVELITRSGSPSADTYLRVIFTVAAALGLLVAGLVAEWLCTVPPVDDDEEADPEQTGNVES